MLSCSEKQPKLNMIKTMEMVEDFNKPPPSPALMGLMGKLP